MAGMFPFFDDIADVFNDVSGGFQDFKDGLDGVLKDTGLDIFKDAATKTLKGGSTTSGSAADGYKAPNPSDYTVNSAKNVRDIATQIANKAGNQPLKSVDPRQYERDWLDRLYRMTGGQ